MYANERKETCKRDVKVPSYKCLTYVNASRVRNQHNLLKRNTGSNVPEI